MGGPLSPLLADSGSEVVRQLIQEVLCYKRAELFVQAHMSWFTGKWNLPRLANAVVTLPA
jgi:hypothetical protein